MRLLDEAVPGNIAVLRGRLRTGVERISERGHRWESQTALVTAGGTGVKEACFCIATEG